MLSYASDALTNSGFVASLSSSIGIDKQGVVSIVIGASLVILFLGIYLAVSCCNRNEKDSLEYTAIYEEYNINEASNVNTNPLFSRGHPSNTQLTQAVLNKLKETFQYGKSVQLYSTKGKRSVIIYLLNSELRWETYVNNGTKKYKLDLKDVMYIEVGKKTKNFLSVINNNPTGGSPSETNCFSLVSNIGTLDIEVSSQKERDELVKIFSDFIRLYKRNVV